MGESSIHAGTYVLDAEDVIADVSPEWLAFASDNGAPDLCREAVVGKPLWSFIAGEETRYLYRLLLKKARETATPIVIPFRCDSPDCRRYMRLELSQLSAGTIQGSGELIRSEPRPYLSLLDLGLARSDSTVAMCSYCKAIRTADDGWVELESGVELLGLLESERPPQVTHGACESCAALVHAELDRLALGKGSARDDGS